MRNDQCMVYTVKQYTYTVHFADNNYEFEKKINILEYALGEGVIKKHTMCTLS